MKSRSRRDQIRTGRTTRNADGGETPERATNLTEDRGGELKDEGGDWKDVDESRGRCDPCLNATRGEHLREKGAQRT